MTGPAVLGHLVDGTFEGGVVRKDRGPGRVELRQDTDYGMPWLDKRSDWSVGLCSEVPLDLDIQTAPPEPCSTSPSSGSGASSSGAGRARPACGCREPRA